MSVFIKDVRVRKSEFAQKNNENFANSDIRVYIEEAGVFGKKRKVTGDDGSGGGGYYSKPGKIIWQPITYDVSGRYDNWTDDQFINDYISTNAKLEGNEKFTIYKGLKSFEYSTYEIIGKYWDQSDKSIKRKFGFDPYFLNNGAKIVIKWYTEEGLVEGGQKWASKHGGEESSIEELDVYSLEDKMVTIRRNTLVKKMVCYPPEKSKGSLPFHIAVDPDTGKESLVEYKEVGGGKVDGKPTKEWSGYNDVNIINDLERLWWDIISNNGGGNAFMKLCSPDYYFCDLIAYEDPLNPKPGVTPNPTSTTPKTKLNITIPSNLIIKAKDDISIIIHVGDLNEVGSNINNVESRDEFGNLTELDDEYSEGSFAAEEEKMNVITQTNAIDDEPVGPSFDESLDSDVNKSPIGSGPVIGSKLTNKAGTSMINLAGHRLKPILKDLEDYLNKNGYTGAKIGNNGIMRDLRASAYPSSSKRATASLHGAGLAIDVTFNIPGFKWTSISDNANLASDAKLTKVINKFIKGQSDITWGASWNVKGKPSKPEEGIVMGRGITEYHHFEIRADLIPTYWEPVKDELAKFGFKPTDLKSPGKDTNLHKLMLKLLGAVV
jgi:hypothetical protein